MIQATIGFNGFDRPVSITEEEVEELKLSGYKVYTVGSADDPDIAYDEYFNNIGD